MLDRIFDPDSDIKAHEEQLEATKLFAEEDGERSLAEVQELEAVAAGLEAKLPPKHLAHGLVGGLTAAIGGGNFLQGAAAAGLNELASKQLDESIDNPVLRNLSSALLGAAIGGEQGALITGSADLFNRQMHPDLALLIGEKAAEFAAKLGLFEKSVCSAEDIEAAKAILAAAAYERDDAEVSQSIISGEQVKAGKRYLNALADNGDLLRSLGVSYENVRAATEAERNNQLLNIEYSNDQLIADLNGVVVRVDQSYYWHLLRHNQTGTSPTALLGFAALSKEPDLLASLNHDQAKYLIGEIGSNLNGIGNSPSGAALGNYLAITEYILDVNDQNPSQGQELLQAFLGPEAEMTQFGAGTAIALTVSSGQFEAAFLNDYLESGKITSEQINTGLKQSETSVIEKAVATKAVATKEGGDVELPEGFTRGSDAKIYDADGYEVILTGDGNTGSWMRKSDELVFATNSGRSP